MFSDDLMSLGKALSKNTSLELLRFHANFLEIPSGEILEFASYLAKNNSIRYCSLSGFPVIPFSAEEDGEHFLNIMRSNVTMEEFYLNLSTRDTPRWLHEYRALLRLNRAGRRYVRQDPTNHLECVNVLDAARDDLDCLYLHLRENPSICNAK